jgi:hypothetical protein
MITNRKHLEIGDILYGYCDGYFGRDSYYRKVVIGLGGDWVVVRELDYTPNQNCDDPYNYPDFACGLDIHEHLIKSSNDWETDEWN